MCLSESIDFFFDGTNDGSILECIHWMCLLAMVEDSFLYRKTNVIAHRTIYTEWCDTDKGRDSRSHFAMDFTKIYQVVVFLLLLCVVAVVSAEVQPFRHVATKTLVGWW